MHRFLQAMSLVVLMGIGAAAGAAGAADAVDSKTLRAQFASPPRQYSSGPLWVWNDMLTEEQIRSTLEDLASQRVKQAWVHPRPGLMTPYLGDDWFRLWKVALREAERLDMNIWIYDENSYPSGFAGGLVPEAMPESRIRGLVLREQKQPAWGDGVFAIYRLSADGYENVTGDARAGGQLPEGKYLVATWKEGGTSGWFGGYYYVDLLKPGVTEKFIEVTFDAYAKQLGSQLGRRVPGIFTDEPHLMSWGSSHWNEHLREEFRKRWGYDMEDHFPALVRPVGDWRRIRHNYQQVLLEQFVEHWGRPCHDWCERHGVEFTGHYWEHGWPGTSHGPDNMAMYAWHQRPAIDTLMNRYDEGVHAQFGNVRAVKELSSVANQLGRRRTLCEAYGAGGWDLRFEDMKRIGDWLYVLGVNTLNEHLSYITIRGARKRDHPQSFSYHAPWWDSYHVMADYFTRLSLVLSSGQEVNEVLVIEPTTTAWMYQGDPHLNEIGNSFQKLVTDLSKAQVEYDIGCEDIIARNGKVRVRMTADADGKLESKRGYFQVRHRDYSTVVLPPDTENLNHSTVTVLEQYVNDGGGRVLCCGRPPSLVDGKPSEVPRKLAEQSSWQQVEPAALPEKLLALEDAALSIRQADDGGILFHHRRRLDDGDILFLTNTSMEAPAAGEIAAVAAGIERWDLATGAISAYPFTKGEKGIKARFELSPCGSLLLFLSKRPGEIAKPQAADVETIEPAGPPEIRRVEPNVLTLDYVDVAAGGETKRSVYFYKAQQFVFQKHGLPRNPWDSAVQFRDSLIAKKFPAESGFEATYRFTIEERVPERLQIVIERPDLYAITCNGKPVGRSGLAPTQSGTTQSGKAGKSGGVRASPDLRAWWLDRAFGRIDLAGAAKVGENAVTVRASPMTIYHELEPAYVLGDFALKAADAGFAIVPRRPLKLGPWNEQGYPFYAAGVAYEQRFRIGEPSGRYYVRLPKWYGAVAKVVVNGKPAGHIAWQPWQCEVTGQIKPGENTVEVVVIGTLKNTLGPHHGKPQLGTAWPRMFQIAPNTGPPPGQQYHTVGYGLFEPFVLERWDD